VVRPGRPLRAGGRHATSPRLVFENRRNRLGRLRRQGPPQSPPLRSSDRIRSAKENDAVYPSREDSAAGAEASSDEEADDRPNANNQPNADDQPNADNADDQPNADDQRNTRVTPPA
jgi:hypothetical protein